MEFAVPQLAVIGQAITDILECDRYILLCNYFPQGEPSSKTPDDIIEEWRDFQNMLHELRMQQTIWLQVTDSMAKDIKKADSARKLYKKAAAVVSQLEFLTSIARDLFKLYDFPIDHDDPTFDDVLKAVGFQTIRHIHKFFDKGENPLRRYTTRAGTEEEFLEHMYFRDDWVYLKKLNRTVNSKLHSALKIEGSKYTVLLEEAMYDKDRVLCIFRATRGEVLMRIKNADGDSDDDD